MDIDILIRNSNINSIQSFRALQCPRNALHIYVSPVFPTCPLHTNSKFEKERRISALGTVPMAYGG